MSSFLLGYVAGFYLARIFVNSDFFQVKIWIRVGISSSRRDTPRLPLNRSQRKKNPYFHVSSDKLVSTFIVISKASLLIRNVDG
jgi:hypothetical protein